MKLKALDTLHISALGPDAIPPGGEFTVGAADGALLVKRGHAVEIADVAADAVDAAGEKAEAAPLNKAEAPPLNKEAAPAPAKRVRAPAAKRARK